MEAGGISGMVVFKDVVCTGVVCAVVVCADVLWSRRVMVVMKIRREVRMVGILASFLGDGCGIRGEDIVSLFQKPSLHPVIVIYQEPLP